VGNATLGLCHEGIPLPDSEAVLLIDNAERKTWKFNRCFKDGMRSHDDHRLAGFQLLK
jgi:hypothetical protein